MCGFHDALYLQRETIYSHNLKNESLVIAVLYLCIPFMWPADVDCEVDCHNIIIMAETLAETEEVQLEMPVGQRV